MTRRPGKVITTVGLQPAYAINFTDWFFGNKLDQSILAIGATNDQWGGITDPNILKSKKRLVSVFMKGTHETDTIEVLGQKSEKSEKQAEFVANWFDCELNQDVEACTLFTSCKEILQFGPKDMWVQDADANENQKCRVVKD